VYYSRNTKIFYLLNYSISRESRSGKFKPSISIYFSLVILFSLAILVVDLGVSILIDPVIEDSEGLIVSLEIRISI
jgi:hypothetical protein